MGTTDNIIVGRPHPGHRPLPGLAHSAALNSGRGHPAHYCRLQRDSPQLPIFILAPHPQFQWRERFVSPSLGSCPQSLVPRQGEASISCFQLLPQEAGSASPRHPTPLSPPYWGSSLPMRRSEGALEKESRVPNLPSLVEKVVLTLPANVPLTMPISDSVVGEGKTRQICVSYIMIWYDAI